MIGIYKITNKINGKSYIGQSNNIKRRWMEHKKYRYAKDKALYKAFEKYGLENFTFDIIEECSLKELDNREIYYIEKFNSYKDGYNETLGGQGVRAEKNNLYNLFKNDNWCNKKIPPKHWKIYYYLFSISKFNADEPENSYYVYRKNFNISQACKILGIKSNSTFYNAVNRLEQYHLIRVTEDILYLYAQDWIDISRNVLINLVKYSRTNDMNIDLLRTFLILKKINKIAQTTEEKSFTIRQISILLGHGDTTPKRYEEIKIYLALLSFWGLIELKQHREYNNNLGAYTIYHLQEIKETDLNEGFEENIEAEMVAPFPSEDLMNKLKFSFSEILDNN